MRAEEWWPTQLNTLLHLVTLRFRLRHQPDPRLRLRCSLQYHPGQVIAIRTRENKFRVVLLSIELALS